MMMPSEVVTGQQVFLCRLYHKKVCASVESAALTERFSNLKQCTILGGNSADSPAGRFSYWMAEAREVFESIEDFKGQADASLECVNDYETTRARV